MRTPHHETGDSSDRRCIITGARGPRAGLLRLALGPDGNVAPDVRARAPGRGAWIGVDRSGLEAAFAKGKLKAALIRAFKTNDVAVADDLAARTEIALERGALDRIGLEARASTLVTGSDRIAEAARRGKIYLLLHAGDASDDGCRKLDQAWRVGSDAEGSGVEGFRLTATRAQLSQALGRENVVHIGVTDAGAARRIAHDLHRWEYFIGHARSRDLAESPFKVQGDAAHVQEQEAGSDK